MPETAFRCGSVAIVGRPNVGKSTLLNHLIGQKISITSRKPQTTRYRILGVLTQDEAQFIFLDTPGLQNRHGGTLNRSLNRSATQAMVEVDAILWLVEGLQYDARDAAVLRELPPEVPVVLAISKHDRVRDKKALLPHIAKLSQLREFAAIVPVSVKDRAGLKALLAVIAPLLPRQAAIYPDDDLTDRDERFLAAEFVREKLYRSLGEEIPYATHVFTRAFTHEGALRRISVEILVSRAGHKAIILGRGGEKLKAIASAARADMEACFGGQVFLEVQVSEREGWERDARALKEFGYR